MPIYTFKCPTCSKVLDELVPMDTKTIECPNCNCAMQRQVSGPAGMVYGVGAYKPSLKSSSDPTT